jgi:WD repeat-containing protein 76
MGHDVRDRDSWLSLVSNTNHIHRLKPQWQRHPQDGLQKMVIGNMNRFVDIYAADGTQLAQLGGDGITAVPAVAVFHPTQDWVTAGTASGKLCLWM